MHFEKDEDKHAESGKRTEQKGKYKITRKCIGVKLG